MKITKALIIAEPWIDYLLDGSKIWEMRSTAATHRGWFGLIRKGSGEVHGIARLVDVGTPLSIPEMLANIESHRIPEHIIRSGIVAKWNTPWKLADIHRLERPVSYRHKNGAVTWVEINTAAVDQITEQAFRIMGPLPDCPDTLPIFTKNHNQPPASEAFKLSATSKMQFLDERIESKEPGNPLTIEGRTLGEIQITEGNIANGHIYLRSIFDHFPRNAVGGSNKDKAAQKSIFIDWGGPEPVMTDIDGTKKFFRARSWIGSFFTLNNAQAGDMVLIKETAPYQYQVSMKKSSDVPH